MAVGSPSSRGRGRNANREVVVDKELRALAIVVVLGTIMSIFDTTIVNVAIDTLGRTFHSPLSTIQWVSTAYLLALAIVIPLSGWSIERFGAKRMYLISLSLFIGGSVLCGLAWSSGSLIAFRALQGFGGGMILPIGQTILARAAGPQRMGRVMSIVGIPMLLGPVLGPAIGGILVDNFDWRWIFYVNVPIGLLALLLSARTLKSDATGTAGKLDILGLSLLSPALALIVYGLSEAGSSGGFGGTTVIVGIVAGFALLAAFIWHALRAKAPLIDLRLFKNRGFTSASITGFLLSGTVFGAMFLLPLYYQVVRGQSALSAGLLMAPQGIGAMLAMPISGRITDRVGAYRIVPFGVAVVVIGTIAYTQVTPGTSEVLLAGSLFIRGLGLGMSMMPSMSAGYQTLQQAEVPRATTTINIVRQVGASLGTAVLAVILQRQIISSVGGGGHAGGLLGGTAAIPEAAQGAVAQAFGHSFWWAVGLSVLCIFPALMLPRVRPEAAAAKRDEAAEGRIPEPV
ncbi:MAG TPA: MDR family MFS transporter [Frankiaceae bacterium]|nr:MDR family MFS transporter [Frankiaceae bacterium]